MIAVNGVAYEIIFRGINLSTLPVQNLQNKKIKSVQLDSQRLRNFIPLQSLTEESLVILVKYAKVFHLKCDDVLFDYGDCSPYSYLLLDGELETSSKDGSKSRLIADVEQALYPIGSLIPRQIKAVVTSKIATLVRIDRNVLEKELTWGQAGSNGKLTICELSGLSGENYEWMLSLLHSPLFFRLPMSNIQVLFQRFSEFHYGRGDVVIKEGDPGDKFFIIRSGTCKITRNSWGKEVVLGTLKAPEGFGEQALISDQPRAATVVMETAGTLMALSKKDFVALMQAPLQKRIKLSEAMNLVWNNKGRLIDVRSEVEFNRGHLKEARNIPLYLLYLKSMAFVPARQYIVYCDSGARSEAAAFLLAQRGFNAQILEGAAEALATVNMVKHR
jgi:CRP-like cAMP-binding protein